MRREVQFKVPHEIPKAMRFKIDFKSFLISLVKQMGVFGREGQDVGFGFLWETQTPANGQMRIVSRYVQRALIASGLISRAAEVYYLPQRIVYVRDKEPSVTITLRED